MTTPPPAPSLIRRVIRLGPVATTSRHDLRRALARLAALGTPAVVAPCRITAHDDVVDVEYEVSATSVPAAQCWHDLTDGEALTVLLAMTQGIAALHSADLVDGAVCLDRVLLDGAGSVQLTDTGAAWNVSGGELLPDRSVDIAAVAQLVSVRFGRDVSDIGGAVALGVWLEHLAETVAPLPAVAPLVRVAPEWATPVQPEAKSKHECLPLDSDLHQRTERAPAGPRHLAPRRPRLRGRARSRRLAAAIGVGALVVAVPTAARAVRQPSQQVGAVHATGAVIPKPAPSLVDTADWEAALKTIDQVRQRALSTGDADLLATAVDPASAAGRRDQQLLAIQQGRQILGGEVLINHIAVLRSDDSRAVLRVVDERTSYQVFAADGTRLAHVPARTVRMWRVILERTGDQWRLHSVVNI